MDMTERKNMLINEIMNTKGNYKVITSTGNTFITRQTIGKREIDFIAYRHAGVWNIAFGENTENGIDYEKTGKGKEFEVFAMVKASIEELIEKHKPEIFQFNEDKEHADKLNRTKLYDRFCKKFKVPGYSYEKNDGESRDVFRFEKSY
jgi:hypothetical protein